MCKRFSFRSKFTSSRSGQSLVETALLVPLVLLIVFYAVNFGYYFFVALNLTSAPHMGVEYSIQGFSTPAEGSLPVATPASNTLSVSYLTYQEMVKLNGSANAIVQVCTAELGTTGSGTGTSNCAQVNPGGGAFTFPSPAADPEPSAFVLNEVDVWYTVNPLIPAGIFGMNLTPPLQFARHVRMRAMD